MSLELVLITGMSGSGKSVALHALEDTGYNCVDNLPPELLLPFIDWSIGQQERRQAIAIDVRSAQTLPLLPGILLHARRKQVHLRLLFLDAATGTLVQRFSETRRRHPLSVQDPLAVGDTPDLTQAIEREREVLTELTRNEGKPEAQIEKIVEGRLNSFYKDYCLEEQAFVKDPKETVGKLVAGLGGGATIRRFARVKIGED